MSPNLINFKVFERAGYLKAVWPDFLGAFLRSGRPRGPGKALKSVVLGLVVEQKMVTK